MDVIHCGSVSVWVGIVRSGGAQLTEWAILDVRKTRDGDGKMGALAIRRRSTNNGPLEAATLLRGELERIATSRDAVGDDRRVWGGGRLRTHGRDGNEKGTDGGAHCDD
jgi:hypothetical protein